jgi:hypothetical protein
VKDDDEHDNANNEPEQANYTSQRTDYRLTRHAAGAETTDQTGEARTTSSVQTGESSSSHRHQTRAKHAKDGGVMNERDDFPVVQLLLALALAVLGVVVLCVRLRQQIIERKHPREIPAVELRKQQP